MPRSPTSSGVTTGIEKNIPKRVVQDTIAFGRFTLQAWFDWGFFFLEMALLIVSEFVIEGKRMFITAVTLEDLMMPHIDNTVPSWAVPVTAMVGSLVVLSVHKHLAQPPPGVFHNAVLSAWIAMASTALMTNILKLTVRPLHRVARPH